MVFAIDSFTRTDVTLWGYRKLTSINIVLYSSILAIHNINDINDTNIVSYGSILAIYNIDHINSIHGSLMMSYFSHL